MRVAIVVAVACLSAAGLCAGQDVQASIKKSTNIPAQELVPALKTLAHERGFRVVFIAELVGNRHTQGAVGELTTTEALTKLLAGTNLVYSYLDDKTVTIIPVNSNNKLDGEGPTAGKLHRCFRLSSDKLDSVTSLNQTASEGASDCAESYSQQNQVLASAIAGEEPVQNSDGESNLEKDSTPQESIEQVIVTAQKRSQNIYDIPQSISALTAQDIERRSLVGMGDYLNTVPGVSMQDMGAGRNSIVIRGLGLSESDQDITGVYFGEVPLTSLSYFGSPDVKLVDITRVEVLRGPQGTLYGAGAMGGAVRNIPTAPDADQFTARLSAEQSFTALDGGPNWNLAGVLNLPVVDGVLAVRAVGYRFHNSGYYVNRPADAPIGQVAATYGVPELAVNKNHVGTDEYTGGRVSVLWTPTENFKATAIYMRQALVQDGFPEVQLNLNGGAYEQARLQLTPYRFGLAYTTGGDERLKDNLELANLVLEYNLGWGTLLSSSSYVHENAQRLLDNSNILSITLSQVQANVPTGLFQEVRLASALQGPAQFIVGAYYEDMSRRKDIGNQYDGAPAENPFGGEVALVDIGRRTDRKQKALFGEVTYNVTKSLAATGGARFFSYDVSDAIAQSGALTDPSNVVLKAHQSDSTYKGSLTYTVNRNALVYAQWAQGFRLGYPQQPVILAGCDQNGDGLIDGTNVSTGISIVKSDSLDSLELGGKFRLFDDRVAVNLALYRTDWKGLPVNTSFACHAEVTLNVGEAVSKGGELSVDWRLGRNLKGNLNASYTNAKVARSTEGFGSEGQRLPLSPKMSYSLGLQYDWHLGAIPGYVAADASYRGSFYNDLAQTPPTTGGYYLLDARAGLNFQHMEASIYVKNLANRTDLTYLSQQFDDIRGYRLRPRTVGVQLTYHF